MRVRAKICGITRLADAQAAVAAGCDALGFNFHEASPRYVSPEQARAIIAAVPPFVACVGLFVDMEADEARRLADIAGVGLSAVSWRRDRCALCSGGVPVHQGRFAYRGRSMHPFWRSVIRAQRRCSSTLEP